MMKETAAPPACRKKKNVVEEWERSCASTLDELYTITTPKQTRNSTVKKRTQSVFSRCAIDFDQFSFLQYLHEIFDLCPAMFITLKLVEAGTGGRQQNGVSRHCM